MLLLFQKFIAADFTARVAFLKKLNSSRPAFAPPCIVRPAAQLPHKQ
jgi:hypothetical protein